MFSRSFPRTSRPRTLSGLLCALALLALGSPVGAQERDGSGDATEVSGGDNNSSNSPSTTAVPAEVEGTTSQRQVAASSVASLQQDRAAVRAELAAASSARDRQFDKWALNHLALEAAQAEVNRTLMLAEQARREVVHTEGRVRAYAVEAFMNPPAAESLAVLSIADADGAQRAHDLLSITAEDQHRVVGELEVARGAAERRSAEADAAASEARQMEADAKAELERLEAALERQRRVAGQIEQRLDSALAEVAALKSVDREAAAELEAGERSLADDSRAALGGRSGGSAAPTPALSPVPASRSTAPAVPATTSTPRPRPTGPPPAPPAGTVTWQDVVKVGGIWVHRSIAGQVQALLSAAGNAGISLGGGGFRDPSEQIRLRQKHCGPTEYDIYSKPSSQCTPPTAPPGRSMHERGLAIDFTSGGALITSRSHPAYQWLAANAGSYGFSNLPSEPWHWSTNGT